MFTNRGVFLIIICLKALLKANPSASQGAQCGRGSPGYRVAIVEQGCGLSATGATGEPCNNDTSMGQMSSRGFGFKTHGCRRVCGGCYTLMDIICLKSLQVLEFLLKSGSWEIVSSWWGNACYAQTGSGEHTQSALNKGQLCCQAQFYTYEN